MADWQETLDGQTRAAAEAALAESSLDVDEPHFYRAAGRHSGVDEPDLGGLPEAGPGVGEEGMNLPGERRPMEGADALGEPPGYDTRDWPDDTPPIGSDIEFDTEVGVAAPADDIEFDTKVREAIFDEAPPESAVEGAPELKSAPSQSGDQDVVEESSPAGDAYGEAAGGWENTRRKMTRFSEGTPTPEDAYNQFLAAYKSYLAGQ